MTITVTENEVAEALAAAIVIVSRTQYIGPLMEDRIVEVDKVAMEILFAKKGEKDVQNETERCNA